MRSSLVSAALLCFTTWMSVVYATPGLSTNCCLQWSTTKVPLHRVRSYTNQSEGVCPITAIIFHTKKGKNLCSDPNDGWAKKAMKKVDEEGVKKTLQEMGQNEDSSTSDIPTVASVKSKNSTRRRDRNGRRRQGKGSRKGKKGQRKRV